MDLEHGDDLYERLEPPALDAAWRAFYRSRAEFMATGRPWLVENDMLRARNRLILHYAPIVKHAVWSVFAQQREDVPSTIFAQALIAVINGMMRRRADSLNDWTPTCVRLATEACRSPSSL
jgi:hypothetical protein